MRRSVSTLCAQLDAVFSHGLKGRGKKGHELSATHAHPHPAHTRTAYWPLVRELLSPVEVGYFSSLSNISTDSGRG